MSTRLRDRGVLPDWGEIDTVMLDMDGTLLDRHFDDYFWEQYVPEHYALENNIAIDVAKRMLKEAYRQYEGTLEWTNIDFWSERLGLDIPCLKGRVDTLIAVHPYVIDFLTFCHENNKKTMLVTNAHGKTLSLKLRKTAIGAYFDEIVCSQEVGTPKEDVAFWEKLQHIIPYAKERTLLADDTPAVLKSAASYGIKWLVLVARPSSRLPVRSEDHEFKSIAYFKELVELKHGG